MTSICRVWVNESIFYFRNGKQKNVQFNKYNKKTIHNLPNNQIKNAKQKMCVYLTHRTQYHKMYAFFIFLFINKHFEPQYSQKTNETIKENINKKTNTTQTITEITNTNKTDTKIKYNKNKNKTIQNETK